MKADDAVATDALPLSRTLAEELHSRIVSGEVPLGSWLRQDAIAEEFGMSRTPVREALQILHGQGIVEVVPHRGAMVRGPTPRDIRENCEVRAELEGFAAELAASRINDQELDRLNATQANFARLVDKVLDNNWNDRNRRRLAKEWADTNERFHSTVLDAANNHQLATSVHDLSQRFPRNMSFTALWGHSHLIRANADEHAAIAAALEVRDAVAARREVRAHMVNAGQLLSRWYEDEVWTRAEHAR